MKIAQPVEPCPFCHSPFVGVFPIYPDHERNNLQAGQCPDCRAVGPVATTAQMALREWNLYARENADAPIAAVG